MYLIFRSDNVLQGPLYPVMKSGCGQDKSHPVLGKNDPHKQ
jgi:hypothetical protein